MVSLGTPVRRMRVPRPTAPLAAQGAICSTTTARVIRYRRALPFLPPPWARQHAGANTSPNRTTSHTHSMQRWHASPPTTPRRLPAHCDPPAAHCCHRPTSVSAVLPSTTFIASCMHSTCDGRSTLPALCLSPPRAPRASPASTTLPDPRARRVLACTTPRVRSTRSSHSPSPAPRLSPPCPPLLCPAPDYPPLEASSCPALGVQRAASLEHAANPMSIPHRPRTFITSPGTAPIFCADASDCSKP
jgi:hypothetical protein